MIKLHKISFQIANVQMARKEERVEPRFFLYYWYTSTETSLGTIHKPRGHVFGIFDHPPPPFVDAKKIRLM